MMLRKLAAAVAVAGSVGGVLGSGSAFALGLGDIRLNSALNQPLNADIELVQVKDLTSGEVLPSLATREDFKRAGVDRPYFLSSLKFETKQRPDGTAYVRVTSKKPVVEPYLNFLVEVHWPSGRLLREYTLLLDPPAFSNKVVADVAAQSSKSPDTAAQERGNLALPTPPAPKQAVEPVKPAVAERPTPPGSYRVQRDDTLWEVALKTRPGRDVSPVKMMAALQTENPRAFINGNINLLKQGSLLRIPDRGAIDAMDTAAASQRVAQQNRDWRKRKVQVDATRKDEVAPTARGTVTQDRLNIVGADSVESSPEGADQGGGKASGKSRDLARAITVNQEQLDTLSRENNDLKERLKELEDQIASLEKLVVLKSDQLTAIQSLDQVSAEAAQSEAVDASADSEAAPVDYNYQDAEPLAENSDGQTADVATAETATDDNAADNALAPAAELEQPDSPAQPEGVAEPTPQPVPGTGLIDSIVNSPLYLALAGGTGALLLALLTLGLVRRRRQTEELDEDVPLDAAARDMGAGFEPVEQFPEQLDEAATDVDDQLDIDQELLEEVEPSAGKSADVLAEAEIYINYGRHDQAVELLDDALTQEPNREDLRIKLLELLAETGNAQAFVAQQQALEAMGSDEGVNRAAELRSRFADGVLDQAAAEQTVADTAVDHVDRLDLEPEIASDEQAQALSSTNDDLDFDLGDLDFEADLDNEQPPLDDLKLDIDSLGEEIEAELAAETGDAVEAMEFSQAVEETPAEEVKVEADTSEAVESKVTRIKPPAQENVNLDSELEQLDAELESLTAGLDQGAVETTLQPEEVDTLRELSEAPGTAESDASGSETEQSGDVLKSALDAVPAETQAPAGIDDIEQEFSFLEDTDETATKLDLARAYMEMGDEEGARDILDEVIREGDDSQQSEARELMDKIGS